MVSLSVRLPKKLPRASVAMACANGVFALPRALVSQNKRRFKQGGYDLDLCYVHPRVIVMGASEEMRASTKKRLARDGIKCSLYRCVYCVLCDRRVPSGRCRVHVSEPAL